MQLFSSSYLFKGLLESQIKSLLAIANEEHVTVGQFLMREGYKAEALFVLKEGAVELLTAVDNDFELPIAILRQPGDCTGTSSLLPPYKYSLSCRCSQEGKILVIRQTRLKELMTADHTLGCTIMSNLAQHYLERLKEARQELKIHFKTIFKSIH